MKRIIDHKEEASRAISDEAQRAAITGPNPTINPPSPAINVSPATIAQDAHKEMCASGFYLNADNAPISNWMDGIYRAQLKAIVPDVTVVDGQVAPTAAWFTFDVVTSSGKSLAEVSQYFALHWTPKSKLARAVSTLLGRPLTAEEELGDVHTSDLIGKWCRLKIASRRRSGYGQRCTIRIAEVIPVLQVEHPDVDRMEKSIPRLCKQLTASTRR